MTWKHREIEITIDSYGVFLCEVGEAKLDAKTLEEIQGKIDKEVSATAKRQLLLSVVCILKPEGFAFSKNKKEARIHHGILTGVHRNTGELQITGVPKEHNFYSPLVDNPENTALLERLLAAEIEQRSLQGMAHDRTIGLDRRHRRIEAHEYEAVAVEIEKDYERLAASVRHEASA